MTIRFRNCAESKRRTGAERRVSEWKDAASNTMGLLCRTSMPAAAAKHSSLCAHIGWKARRSLRLPRLWRPSGAGLPWIGVAMDIPIVRRPTRADYLDDLESLFVHPGLERAELLGNSLGGVNAYQFAARHPESVRALIIEDIRVVIADDTSFALAWSGTFKTRGDLEERIGPRLMPYLRDSFRSVPGGCRTLPWIQDIRSCRFECTHPTSPSRREAVIQREGSEYQF